MSKSSFFTCLVLLSVVAIASGQTGPHKPRPNEPLEEYDNPPAPYPLWGIGVSPGMVVQEGPFTSHQVNVNANGQNITGDAANEPSIAVDPTNRSRIVIGWRQFDSVTSNFRQAGWGYTSNGGTTWTFPGVLESGVFRSDPVLGSDDTGRFFYLSLLQSFFTTMWRSLDGGQTFTNIAPATGGDKQWFVVDNTTSIGHGFQYQFWDNATPYGTREFSRSTDGGFTWMDPINIPNAPQWGTPDVDSNGNLFFGGVSTSLTQFWCLRSTDAKNGAVIPSFDQSTAVNLGGRIDYQDTINPVGLIGQVFLAVDRSGTSTNNNVYMMASVQPTGFNTGSDVMFVRSTNGGQTFSPPRRVNDDPVNHSKWHWLGTLSVAPNGRIDSVWLDTRNAANNTDSQLFYSYSTDAGNTWSPNVAVSPAFNPFLGYPNQNKMGDYMTIVSDNTGGNVAYAATFNLEEDVYYVRVAPPPVNISGNISYCPGSPRPVPDVILNLTGDSTGSTTTNGSGDYTFSSLPSGGTYTVTPSRSNLPPGLGTSGIDTADALAVQKHLACNPCLTGCALAAAHTNANNPTGTITIGEALFIQAFYLFLPNPVSVNNVSGQWRFNPANRTYSSVNSNQTGQNYDAFALGDVNGDLTFPPPVDVRSVPTLPTTPMSVSVPVSVTKVALPNVDPSLSEFVAAVTTSNIDAGDELVAFQGDFTFDSSVVTFQSTPVARAGLTANGNWALAANVLGTGTIKTLRVSCFALDGKSVLSGEGPLFELRMTRVSSEPGASTQLIWAAAPNNFIFLDDNVHRRAPASTPPGSVTARPATGRR